MARARHLASALSAAVSAGGCDRTVTEHIEGNDGSVAITFLNPTSCSECDPWRSLDELRVEVVQDEAVVASETFDYPAESIVLPDLDGFGVVRIVLVGLSYGEVKSAGRTAPLPVGPGIELGATMVFLPVNEALPLTQPMVASRSRHVSLTLRDGRVLMAGGLSPARDAAYSGMEIYDTTTGRFGAAPYNLASDAYEPRLLRSDAGEVVFLGGGTVVGGVPTGGTASTSFYEEEARSFAIVEFGTPRDGHCVAQFGRRQAAVFGGHTGSPTLEYFRRDDAGVWENFPTPLADLDDTHVSNCLTLADANTFVQGIDADSTGLWTYNDETAPYISPREAFDPVSPVDAGEAAVFAAGVSLSELSNGHVWVGGGIEAGASFVVSQAREFNPAAMKFGVASAQPKRARFDGRLTPWIETGWQVWGCGWSDAARASPEPTLELFDQERGAGGPVVGLDRVRDGCDVHTLADGAILVSGGFDASDLSAISAAIVVPWVDDE